MKFKISGTFKMNKKAQPFIIDMIAKDKKLAREKIFCLLGSWYKCKRNFVNIKNIKEIKNG